jgi:hypothetical protein
MCINLVHMHAYGPSRGLVPVKQKLVVALSRFYVTDLILTVSASLLGSKELFSLFGLKGEDSSCS